MIADFYQDPRPEIDADTSARYERLTVGTRAVEFVLTYTSRTEDTGELIIDHNALTPEISRAEFSIFERFSASGLSPEGALAISSDELDTIRQTLFDKSSCD